MQRREEGMPACRSILWFYKGIKFWWITVGTKVVNIGDECYWKIDKWPLAERAIRPGEIEK